MENAPVLETHEVTDIEVHEDEDGGTLYDDDDAEAVATQPKESTEYTPQQYAILPQIDCHHSNVCRGCGKVHSEANGIMSNVPALRAFEINVGVCRATPEVCAYYVLVQYSHPNAEAYRLRAVPHIAPAMPAARCACKECGKP